VCDSGIICRFDGERPIVPSDTDYFFLRAMRSMDGVFGSVEKRPRSIFNIPFDPFALQHDDRFPSLGVSMSGDKGSCSKPTEQEAGSGNGVMG